MRKATIFGAIFVAAALVSGEASAATSYSSVLCKIIPFKSLRVSLGCDKDVATNPTKPTNPTTPTNPTNPTTPTNPTNPTTPTNPTPSSYSASLSWTIPSAREDGKALSLSELSGYEVYYTTDASSTSKGTVVKIDGGNKSSYVVSGLPAGTYYFAISAIDTNGLKSALSSMVSAKFGP